MPEPKSGNDWRALDVPFKPRELPADVAQARLEHTAEERRLAAVANPRIDAVLRVCKEAAQQLETLHSDFADRTDLDLTGYSRAAAIWMLAGRQLGLHHALVAQVEAGIATEAMVTGRAIHEAARVLQAFSVPDEAGEKVVRMWLDDEGRHGHVKQGAARAAQDHYETELAEAMEAAGMDRLEATKPHVEELYDALSRAAHNRRSSCATDVWAAGRRMVYGRNAPTQWRADAAEWGAAMTTEVVLAVGDGLRALYSRQDFVNTRIAPLVLSIEHARASSSLDEDSLRRAAGLG